MDNGEKRSSLEALANAFVEEINRLYDDGSATPEGVETVANRRYLTLQKWAKLLTTDELDQSLESLYATVPIPIAQLTLPVKLLELVALESAEKLCWCHTYRALANEKRKRSKHGG